MNESSKGNQPRQRRYGGMVGGILIGLLIGLAIGFIQGDVLEGASFGLIIGLCIGAGFEGRGSLMRYRPGAMRRILLAAALFLISLLLVFEFLEGVDRGVLRTLLALAPAATFLLFVLALGWAIAGLDELQRRIQTEAIAIGFGFTAVAVLTVGLLGQVGFEQPNWIYAGLPLVLGWVLGKLWTMWKYR